MSNNDTNVCAAFDDAVATKILNVFFSPESISSVPDAASWHTPVSELQLERVLHLSNPTGCFVFLGFISSQSSAAIPHEALNLNLELEIKYR